MKLPRLNKDLPNKRIGQWSYQTRELVNEATKHEKRQWRYQTWNLGNKFTEIEQEVTKHESWAMYQTCNKVTEIEQEVTKLESRAMYQTWLLGNACEDSLTQLQQTLLWMKWCSFVVLYIQVISCLLPSTVLSVYWSQSNLRSLHDKLLSHFFKHQTSGRDSFNVKTSQQ
jgi:hypothetical protein